MKHLLTILSGLLVALLFARCADDDDLSGGIDGLPERGIVIRLSTGELDTRTQLTSTGDYHHVEEVWAVLYKWNGKESTDPTTDPNNHGNYEFKSATRLNLEDGTPWNPYEASAQSRPSRDDYSTDEAYDTALDDYLEDMQTDYGGEYGNGKVQGREFVLPETNDMTNGTYRVLCIGLDDKSGKVYDLKKDDGNLNLGSTLAEAKAKMTIETKAYEEQTGTYQMYGYDGTGELFAGWTEFEFEPDNINIAEVELKRRVAGILCYVTDIPAKIENTEVKGIRLCLNTKANDEIGLCRLDKPWEDFGAGGGYSSEYAGGTTLAYQDLSDWTTDGEILKKGDEGNLVMGAYIIPINVVKDAASVTNTLSVQLFGGDSYDYEDGNLGELIKTFNVLNEQGHSTERGETAERYNILPNYIYHIGDKDDDTDEPMSLLGQKITVKPKVWTGETIPVEFPSVPIKVSMDLINEYDDVYDADRYVFDCIGIDDVEGYGNATPPTNILGNPVAEPYPLYYPNTQRLYLKVSPSVLKSHWKIKINRCDENGTIITTPDGEDGMLYILKSSGYEQGYEAKSPTEDNEGAKIPLLLTDYAVNNSNIEKRYAKITLEMFESPQASNPIDSEEMIVQQYNAIIVKYDNRVLGFSHYDWGTVRDTRTGEVETDGETAMWNYDWGVILAAEIFGQTTQNTWENGAQNISWVKGRLDDKDRYEAFYDGTSKNGCAMYKAAKYRLQITDSKKETLGNPTWFLPARYEMTQFMNDKFLQRDDYHIKTNAFYWTSSTSSAGYVGSVNHYSIVLKYDVSDVKAEAKERDESYYMRQAVLISQDDN